MTEVVEWPPAHVVTAAVETSSMSPCRSKRGVVIVRHGVVIAAGYNYKPMGDCDGSQACKATCRVEAIHAEQQALLVAGHDANGAEMVHVKTVDGALVPSGGPSCVDCSKLVLVAGIVAVWLLHTYGWRRYPARDFHRLSVQASHLAAVPPTGEVCRNCHGLQAGHTRIGDVLVCETSTFEPMAWYDR